MARIIKTAEWGGEGFCQRSYRIEDERGYCDFTVWDGSDHLGSYGGSLWPHDFPDAFKALPPSVQCGSGRVQIVAKLPA